MKRYLKYMLENVKFFVKNSSEMESGFRFCYYYPVAFCKFMKYMHEVYVEGSD